MHRKTKGVFTPCLNDAQPQHALTRYLRQRTEPSPSCDRFARSPGTGRLWRTPARNSPPMALPPPSNITMTGQFSTGWWESSTFRGMLRSRSPATTRGSASGVTHGQVSLGIAHGRCPRLGSFESFNRCRYRKEARSCAEPDYLIDCPLPRHDLRNGRLNQMAYSLRLFFRDVCRDDFVGWIDQQLSDADQPANEQSRICCRLRHAVIDPMKGVLWRLGQAPPRR